MICFFLTRGRFLPKGIALVFCELDSVLLVCSSADLVWSMFCFDLSIYTIATIIASYLTDRAAFLHMQELSAQAFLLDFGGADERAMSAVAKRRRIYKEMPTPLTIARRVYPDYTTQSYREAMLAAWIVKRSMVPYVARLGPGIDRHIASFLLEITPAPPPMHAEAVERRRKLDGLDDLLNNPMREEDREEMSRERHSMTKITKIVKARRPVRQQMTRASIMFTSARQWLEKQDRIGLVPRPASLI